MAFTNIPPSVFREHPHQDPEHNAAQVRGSTGDGAAPAPDAIVPPSDDNAPSTMDLLRHSLELDARLTAQRDGHE